MRRFWARSIFVLSILASIAGACMIIFSFVLTNSEFIKKIGEAESFESVDDARKFIFLILLVFSCVTIATSLCGLCFSCCNVKSRCVVASYGAILLPTWLIIVIVGGIAAGASFAAKSTVEDQCQDFSDSYLGTGSTENRVVFVPSPDATSAEEIRRQALERAGNNVEYFYGYSQEILDNLN